MAPPGGRPPPPPAYEAPPVGLNEGAFALIPNCDLGALAYR